MQREITRNLSVEVAYVGSHIVHVGIPDSNLNQLTAAPARARHAASRQGSQSLLWRVPISSSIGGKTDDRGPASQALSALPQRRHLPQQQRQDQLQRRSKSRSSSGFDHGTLPAFCLHPLRLIDDASSVFSTTVLSSPNSSSLIAADTFRPWLERDASSGDMPNVTSFSGIYDLPAGHGHRFASSWIRGRTARRLVAQHHRLRCNRECRSRSPRPRTTILSPDSPLQRPNSSASPTCPLTSARPRTSSTRPPSRPRRSSSSARHRATPRAAPPIATSIWRSSSTSNCPDEARLEFRAEVFNISNTPEFAQPNGSFGSAAFGSITSTFTDPRVVQFAIRLSR